jgi:hypothetical protein
VPKTISHESALGRWEMVLARPERDLRPYVRSYCGYDEETVAFSRRRELATPNPVWIVGFGAPIEVSFPDLRETTQTSAFVSGASDHYALVDSFGSQRGVQIDLKPLGAFMLLRLPMHELANRTVELGDILGPDGAQLPERLSEAADWRARFAALDGFLAARVADAPRARPDVAWAGGASARRRVACAWANSRRSFAVADGTSALASPSSLDYRPRRSRGSFGLGVRRASSAPAQLRSPSATKRQIGSAWPRSPLSAATTTRLTSTAIFGSSRGSRPHNSKRCCCRIRAA